MSSQCQRSRLPCPFLPDVETAMSYRNLRQWGGRRDEAFYLTALRYGQNLWQSGQTARGILSLTRALYADIPSGSTMLRSWPLPYQAIAWMVWAHPNDGFLGNPVISFQHQAMRIRGERALIKKARAAATCLLLRRLRPDLPEDPGEAGPEADASVIFDALLERGLNGEAGVWQQALNWVSRTADSPRALPLPLS